MFHDVRCYGYWVTYIYICEFNKHGKLVLVITWTYSDYFMLHVYLVYTSVWTSLKSNWLETESNNLVYGKNTKTITITICILCNSYPCLLLWYSVKMLAHCNRLRLRKKTWRMASTIYLDHQIFEKDIHVYANFEMYIEPLKGIWMCSVLYYVVVNLSLIR